LLATPPPLPKPAIHRARAAALNSPLGSISGDWRSKLKKKATEGAIQGGRMRPMNRWLGKRRRRGQQNNPRGRSTLPVCSARQEKARGCTHSGQRNCLFVNRHCRPYHIHDSKRAVRSSFESRGWYEKAVRREPTQCGYCFSGSIGEAGRPPEFLANERNLCGITLLSRLRSRPILANAAFFSPWHDVHPYGESWFGEIKYKIARFGRKIKLQAQVRRLAWSSHTRRESSHISPVSRAQEADVRFPTRSLISYVQTNSASNNGAIIRNVERRGDRLLRRTARAADRL